MNSTLKAVASQIVIWFTDSSIKIRKENLNSHVRETFEKCLQCCYSNPKDSNNCSAQCNCIIEIDSVLDFLHEELNTGHWSKVSIATRQNFTVASLIKALFILKHGAIPVNSFQQCLNVVDMGLLLGAPLEENVDFLKEFAKIIQVNLNELQPEKPTYVTSAAKETGLKRNLDESQYQKEFEDVTGIVIDEVELPSIETFQENFFAPQIPVKLKGCMTHWPASVKWLDLTYLLSVAGNRTVPVEIGSHYTNEDWSQKLMTLKQFISSHYLSESGGAVGYLAQHNLFDQINELKDDIRIPEYCCCSLNYEKCTEPDINAWLGPKGTVSPLHQDPKNNLLAQVYGFKRVLLYSPEDSSYLYPHGEEMLSNTAQVDPLNLDLQTYPEFGKAKSFKCLLGPGEMLFIPPKWWHHVTALEKSFSVSFWWQ